MQGCALLTVQAMSVLYYENLISMAHIEYILHNARYYKRLKTQYITANDQNTNIAIVIGSSKYLRKAFNVFYCQCAQRSCSKNIGISTLNGKIGCYFENELHRSL